MSYILRAGVAGIGTAGPVLAGPLFRDWPRMRVCVPMKWVWHLLVADRQRVCAGQASCCYGQLCLPRCLETPLTQKRGGAKHIRGVVYTYTEPDRFSKVVPMRNLKRSGSRDSRHG